MDRDSVDKLLEQWQQEQPDLDSAGLGLAVRIELLAKLLQQAAASALSRIGLKTWEYDVLSALRRQGSPYSLPATDLAKASFLTSGAMTTRIDRLEEQGLVDRHPDPHYRRGVRVTLTPDGVATIHKAIRARFDAAESSVESLTAREHDALERGLRKLLLALDPSSDPA